MLTAHWGDLDIVGGLEAGADDYVVKPVEPRVLDARIRAVLRRIARPGSPAETHGELVIDRASLIVRQAGQEVSLTPTELRLLLMLSGSPRQVFSREQLLGLVWEHDYLGDSRLVDACVQRTILPNALQAGHQLVLALGRALAGPSAQHISGTKAGKHPRRDHRRGGQLAIVPASASRRVSSVLEDTPSLR
jgi:CheY-like chemotaxis protein